MIADERSRRIADSLAELGLSGFRAAVVLGSGLGGFLERLRPEREVPFDRVAGMPRSTVPGHPGRFAIGSIGGARLLVQAGRIHLYEGRAASEVCASIRAFAALGCRTLVLTNAAGGLRIDWEPPTLMRIVDHIDRQGRCAQDTPEGPIYDTRLGEAIDEAAAAASVPLARGVYAGLLGPAYETPAEVAMLAWMGADAVGMSTVCEARAARAAGMRVAGISCIANRAAGLVSAPLSHAEVLRAGAQATERLAALLAGAASAY